MISLHPLTQRRCEAQIMDCPDLVAARHIAALRGLARLNVLSISARLVWQPIAKLARRQGRREHPTDDLAASEEIESGVGAVLLIVAGVQAASAVGGDFEGPTYIMLFLLVPLWVVATLLPAILIKTVMYYLERITIGVERLHNQSQ